MSKIPNDFALGKNSFNCLGSLKLREFARRHINRVLLLMLGHGRQYLVLFVLLLFFSKKKKDGHWIKCSISVSRTEMLLTQRYLSVKNYGMY